MLTRENAFLVIMSICLFQLPSSESCSPRCLCSVTVLMIVLFIIRLGWWGLFNFREIVMVSVFCVLKFTSHFVDHAWNFTRSSLSVCAVSCGSSTIKYRLVSSANNCIVELISVSMSFMKTMNKRGPRIDPWGTPAFMSRQLEVELLITTRCFLSDK